MKMQCPYGNLVYETGQGGITAFPKHEPVLADRCQRRIGIGAYGQVVKADNAYIPRNITAQLLALDHSGVRQHIVAAYDGCNPHVQQPGHMLLHGFGNVKGRSGHGGVCVKAVLAHGVEKCFVADLHNKGSQGAA